MGISSPEEAVRYDNEPRQALLKTGISGPASGAERTALYHLRSRVIHLL